MAMNFNFGFGKINRSKQESSNTAFSFEKFNFSLMFICSKNDFDWILACGE